jgi:hypothetical protein
VAVLLAGALLVALASATLAVAAGTDSPWWRVSATTAPTNLPPGGEAKIFVTAINVGDGNVNATGNKVTVTDNLPPGLQVAPSETVPSGATGIAGSLLESASTDVNPGPVTCETNTVSVSCSFEGPKPLIPFVPLEVVIDVKVVGAGPPTGARNEVTVAGGGAPTVSLRRPLTVSSAQTPFGVENLELVAENEGGSEDTQAGSHPFQLTTAIALNQLLVPNPSEALAKFFPTAPLAAAEPKDLAVRLPPGLVGNATTLPQCSEAAFTHEVGFKDACPPETAIGVASATLFEAEIPQFTNTGGVATATVPVFNLVPAKGEPARFGFDAFDTFVTLDTSVRTGEDYAVVTSVSNISEIASVLSSEVTIWGVPSDARHNQSRGWSCLAGDRDASPPCDSLGQSQPAPFLTLPGSCTAPLRSTVLADSWREPGARLAEGSIDSSDSRWKEARFESAPLQGCNQLPFTPSITLQPETQAGSTPTGLHVDVHVPQQPSASANGLAEADVKSTTVTVPRGVLVNPAAAHGLESCSETRIGFEKLTKFEGQRMAVFTPTLPEPFCPEAAKIGTVRVKTPLLAHELEGAVYLAQQSVNPFESLLALYIVAEDPVSGVLVKLAGEVSLDENTGQVVSTFENTPQAPFEDFKVDFFGGPTGQLTTPAYCGTYTTTASLTPWSGSSAAAGAVSASSSFPITSSCTSAPNPQPFAPSLQAGSTNNQAGAFTPFTLTIANPDGDQALRGLTMHLPTGLAAMISSLKPCPEPQAARNECGPESLIGHSTAYAGLGPEPYQFPGNVYLTGPYEGAPFGILVVTPAVAGSCPSCQGAQGAGFPTFNLGNVPVRSTINVDPSTAAVTITSDPFPTFVQGIPTQLKQINVTVDRPAFQFNPTNCNPLAITDTLTGAQGAIAAGSTPFHTANCASLPFHPTFEASTEAKNSKLEGAALRVRVTSQGLGVAGIAKTKVALPIALPSRLTTIQKACLAKVFEANPESCGEGSNIGTAIIHTPVFVNPLRGPAYLVSHGNEAFPDVEFVLKGEGITIILDGKTDIKKGITTSSFEALPDAPFTEFETILPRGPHSALAANTNLCSKPLIMPTTITAQNGAVIQQQTHMRVAGCPRVKGFKRKSKLALALAKCRKQFKHNAHKRARCEHQARKKYGSKKARAHKRH